jgi:hypothetical protein
VVLSKCRRHQGPKPTKILVTNLPETVTAREVVGVAVAGCPPFGTEARPRARYPRVGRGDQDDGSSALVGRGEWRICRLCPPALKLTETSLVLGLRAKINFCQSLLSPCQNRDWTIAWRGPVPVFVQTF